MFIRNLRGSSNSKLNKLIFPIAAFSFTAPLCVFAQQAATTVAKDQGLEELVVTGYRASLEKALGEKKTSAAAIDSIVAEDISKFPDSNLAESLQRIPGVSISRDAGEGRNLTVRGLGSSFTRVRINGMEALATTGATDSSGGNNRERAFDFNVFASELFGSITARKTASADIDEGSLGATVDLQTARPMDHKGFTAAAAAKGIYNDLSGDVDPRVSALISNTWADNTFGVLFSGAYSKRHSVEEGFTTVRWDTGGSSGGFSATSTPPTGYTITQLNNNVLIDPANPPIAYHPRIPRYGRLDYNQDRLGLTGSMQWIPNATNSLTLDLLYSNFKVKRDEYYVEAFSFSRTAAQFGKPATVLLPGAVLDNHSTLVYGSFNNVDMRAENRHDEFTTRFAEATLSGKHELTEQWTIDETLGYQKSDFDNPIQTTITLDRQNSNGYSWDFRGNDRLPALNYGFDVSDAANWQFVNAGGAVNGQSEIRLRPNTVKDSYATGNLNVTFKLDDHLSFKGGFNYKKFKFDATERRRASETTVPVLPTGTTVADISFLVTDFGKGMSIPAGTPTTWRVADINKFNNLFGIYSNAGTFALTDITNNSARGNNRGVEETDEGAFVQTAFSYAVGVPLRGDLGVRYVKTKQSSYGYTVTTAVQKAESEHDYSDVLPSLNLVAELTPDLLLRLGLAKVMSRPALSQVTPGGSISLVGNLSVSSGNPLLDPIRAKTADLSMEWYFGKGSLLSGAVFYKKIDSFVQTVTENKVFNTTGLPLSLLAGTTLTGTETFAFNRPINTPGGNLTGFEINYQQQFRNLPGSWSNFGTLLNYTYVDSKIDYFTTAAATVKINNDLVNLSRNAYNATLFYESNRFNIRASAAYRAKYITKVPASNAYPYQDVEGTNSTLNVDMSASYNINNNFSVSLEGLNLTDQFNDQYIDGASNRAVVYSHTGRVFMAGVRYKF